MIVSMTSSNSQLRQVRDGTIPAAFDAGVFEQRLAEAYEAHLRSLAADSPPGERQLYERELDWLRDRSLPWPGDRGVTP